eukprot:m.293761 g.293761  ORF g.293761 m.293761 type:complete len:324 (-) comp12867_c0_seq1:5-976(-)
MASAAMLASRPGGWRKSVGSYCVKKGAALWRSETRRSWPRRTKREKSERLTRRSSDRYLSSNHSDISLAEKGPWMLCSRSLYSHVICSGGGAGFGLPQSGESNESGAATGAAVVVVGADVAGTPPPKRVARREPAGALTGVVGCEGGLRQLSTAELADERRRDALSPGAAPHVACDDDDDDGAGAPGASVRELRALRPRALGALGGGLTASAWARSMSERGSVATGARGVLRTMSGKSASSPAGGAAGGPHKRIMSSREYRARAASEAGIEGIAGCGQVVAHSVVPQVRWTCQETVKLRPGASLAHHPTFTHPSLPKPALPSQ